MPLPINLLDFQGQMHKDNVVLHWTTSSEENSRRFGIERSYDGVSFQNIGYVNATGNSTITRQYTFTDTSVAHDKNYYRLKEIDQDDKFTYSGIIQVDGNPRQDPLTVSPSPFTTGLDILFPRAPQGKIGIRLMDMTGKTLLRWDNAIAAQDRVHVDVSGLSLPAGVYLLEIRTGTETYVTRIIKAQR